jgi:type II secretory pathway component PulL
MEIRLIKVISISILLILSNKVYSTSICEREWNALKSIQSQLRHKSNEYLRRMEHEKHTKYQNCRKNKNQKSKKIKKSNNSTQYKRFYTYRETKNPFENSPVKMKTKFKGKKQEEWNKYYVTPEDCIKPKTTSQFASCLNDRDREAKRFTELWDEKEKEKR